jgi:hypothetical protein
MSDAINIKKSNEVPIPVSVPAVKKPEVAVFPGEATAPKPVIAVHREAISQDRIRFSGYKRTPDPNKPLVPKKKWFWQ